MKQKQIIISKKNESISKQLYSLSERLLNVSRIEYILLKGNQYIEESIQIKTENYSDALFNFSVYA